MDKLLLALKLGRKRDVIEARQRARQIAGLLGFETGDCARIAAGVFALACQVYRKRLSATVFFQVNGRSLHVFFGKRKRTVPDLPRIEKLLPGKPFFTEADIKWMVGQLVRLPPPSVFDEIDKLNQELLQAYLDSRRGNPHEVLERPRLGARDKTA
jgi:hypothetical protein